MTRSQTHRCPVTTTEAPGPPLQWCRRHHSDSIATNLVELDMTWCSRCVRNMQCDTWSRRFSAARTPHWLRESGIRQRPPTGRSAKWRERHVLIFLAASDSQTPCLSACGLATCLRVGGVDQEESRINCRQCLSDGLDATSAVWMPGEVTLNQGQIPQPNKQRKGAMLKYNNFSTSFPLFFREFFMQAHNLLLLPTPSRMGTNAAARGNINCGNAMSDKLLAFFTCQIASPQSQSGPFGQPYLRVSPKSREMPRPLDRHRWDETLSCPHKCGSIEMVQAGTHPP